MLIVVNDGRFWKQDSPHGMTMMRLFYAAKQQTLYSVYNKKVHKWDKGLHQDFPLISCSPVYKIYVQDKEIKITTAIIDSCYSSMSSQKMLQNIIVEKLSRQC